MDIQDFQLRIKSLSDEGSFTGFASTYGNVDLTGDVIQPGAFTQSIQKQGKGYPLLWAHMQSEPLGLARVSDSREGLVVEGSLVLSDPAAVRALDHLRAGSIRGLSIGFSMPRGEGKVSYSDSGVRTLKEIVLHEISLVAIPANPKAQVTSVKSLADMGRMLRVLREGDIDGTALDELQGIDVELKRLLVGRDPEVIKVEMLGQLRAFASKLAASCARSND